MRRVPWRAIVIALAAIAPFVPMLARGEVPSFRDHDDYYVPLREVTAQAIRSGELPLWNPWSGSGEPWLANPQTGVFYPPAWLIAALPFRLGYVAFLIVHLAILGLGWRHLLLRWTRDDVATLSACVLMASGPVLSLLDVSNSLATFAWIPLVIAFGLEGRRGAAPRDAAVIALSFLGGEPLLAFVGGLLYAGARLSREGRAGFGPTARVALLAVLLSGAQLLPFLESLRGSDRSSGLEPAAALAHSMAPADWLSAPVAPVTPGSRVLPMSSQRFLPSLFVAPLLSLLPLTIVVLWRNGGLPRRAVLGWIALFATSLLLAAGSHLALSRWIYLSAGLAVSRYPVKFALFGVIAIVALGAICLDRLIAGERRAALAGAVVVAAAAALAIGAPAPRAAGSVALLAAWAVAIVLALVVRPPRGWMLAVATVLVCADSISASRFLFVSRPLPQVVAPFDALLRKDRKVARLEQLDRRRDPTASSAGRHAWLGGYLNLRNRQLDVMTAAPVVNELHDELVGYALAHPRLDILDFAGVGYLFTTRAIDAPGFRPIHEERGVKVYARDSGFPSVTVWERADEQPDASAAYAKLYDVSFDARERIIVTGGGAPAPFADATSGPVGRTRVAEMSWTSLRAEVESPRGGVVCVTQRDAPGWSVTVDGVESEPLLVNGLFRGVAVSAGAHTVEWRYVPRSLVLGFLLSVTGVTIACFARISSRRDALRVMAE